MIKTTVRAEISGAVYEYEVELPGTAPWAATEEETAIGLLYDSMDQLVRTLGTEDDDPVHEQATDEFGNRVCYLCGFYHDEPGSCVDSSKPLTNINPGPPEPPEYDGPTMPDDLRYPDVSDIVPCACMLEYGYPNDCPECEKRA